LDILKDADKSTPGFKVLKANKIISHQVSFPLRTPEAEKENGFCLTVFYKLCKDSNCEEELSRDDENIQIQNFDKER